MTTTIANILVGYGFEARGKELVWGFGSLVYGQRVTVRKIGNDLYKVSRHDWLYNCDGDVVRDEREEAILHGALALQYIFEKVELFRRY